MTYPLQKLASISSMKTGKLNSNAAVENGIYPFFTCAQETYRINTAAFNTEAVLLGGNNANGIYPLKYYRGEFNAYQRTYIFETLDKEKLNVRYLYYALKPALKHFQASSIGAATQYLTKPVLDNFEIPLPEVDVQTSIVETLSAYDDLIENNRRRIQLLEESARLLYQEWFVHLRFPGHEQVKIIDGVPEGWSIKRVDSLLGKVAKKKKIKKEEYLEDGVVPCVDQSQEFIGGYIDDEEAAITENLPVVVFGDHTRIVKFIDFPFAPGADGTQLLVPNDEEIPRDFFYFMISSINVANAFYARHFKFLKAKDVLVPEKKLMHEFSLVVKDNMLQIKLLRNQNRSLAKARDLLLPKLMSGELTV